MKKENWKKEFDKLHLDDYISFLYDGEERFWDFIEKLLRQEKEKWEKRFLDELEKWIGVDNLPEFLEKLKNEK